MRRAFDLLNLLADGSEHAGGTLAAALGVTRAAVWNQVSRLREEGVEINATPGQGYVMPAGYEALDAARITGALAAAGCDAVTDVRTLTVTDSTNARLLEDAAAGDVHGHALFAEYQSAGRGRRGDRWMSPPGSGLCFTLGWRFEVTPPTFSALSLVVGLALLEALRAEGVQGIALKWPNDIERAGAKLAGILIEMRAEAGGPCTAVIGVGLNVTLSAYARSLIDRPTDDVSSAAGRTLGRNALAAALLAALARALQRFSEAGFAPFREAWAAHDALAGREISLDLGNRTVCGTACGVDEHGALVIEHGGGRERFMSGHVIVH